MGSKCSKCCKNKLDKGQGGRDLKGAIDGKKKICIWILGGPGCGKGTQCKMLAMHFKLCHLSSGDLVREYIKKNSEKTAEMSATMAKGGLVDTQVVLGLISKAMNDAYESCNGYLIDGFPRDVNQGKLFCEQLGTPHMIVYLDCPDNILVERLLKRGKEPGGRADDNYDVIMNRLELYHSVTEPIFKQWRSKVVTIDASLSPLDVEKECIRVIEKLEEQQRSAGSDF